MSPLASNGREFSIITCHLNMQSSCNGYFFNIKCYCSRAIARITSMNAAAERPRPSKAEKTASYQSRRSGTGTVRVHSSSSSWKQADPPANSVVGFAKR